MKTIFLTAFLLILTGCSVEDKPTDTSTTSSAPEGKTATKTGSSTATAPKPTAAVAADSATLKGYVMSAFEVTVDGDKFEDSEDFYTKQLDKLTAQVESEGYAGYRMSFDAPIGLNDLKANMQVFIASEDGRGYAGDTRVNEKGLFSFNIPADGTSQLYRIRTNKRINVTLTEKDRPTIQWCYNFSGIEASVDVTDPRPVIINEFKTTLTKYACSATQSGIMIPAAAAPAPVPAPTAPTSTATGTATDTRMP